MRKSAVGVLLAAMATPLFAAWDVAQLMAELAGNRGGRVRFVETRHLALLDKPLVSSGEMRFIPPDRLEKRTLAPRAEILVLDKDQVTIERDKQKLSISLASQPQVAAFAGSMRAALTGNRPALEKDFALHLAGTRENWTLSMLPHEQALAGMVLRITISGQKNRVRSIEYLQADGDRALMAIEALPEK